MKKFLRSAAATAVIAVALTGCIRTTVDTTISPDDTFSQHAVIAFSDDLAGQIGEETGVETGGMFEMLTDSDEFAALEEKYPGKVDVAEYDDGELRGVELTLSDLPIEEFDNTAEQTASGVGGNATLERVGDQYIIEMASPETGDLDSLGITESQLALLASSIDVRISYTFPGLVEEATVGEIDGHTVTLDITDLTAGQDIRIVAGAVDAFDWGPLLRWGGIALALILVVGGALALIIQDRRKHRRSSLPPPTTTEMPVGPGVLGGLPEPADATPPVTDEGDTSASGQSDSDRSS